jgi:hypothetical protein
MNINKIVPVNAIELEDYKIPLVCDTIESDKFICRVMDYDGSIIKEEYHASGETFELPSEFPTHDKLIAQEWVGPVEIVDNKVTVTDRDLLFGVTYTTKSGLSEFDIELTKASDLTIGFNMDGTKDWGDGTSDTTKKHTYSLPGKYTITCDGATVGKRDYNYGLFGYKDDQTITFACDIRLGSNVTMLVDAFGNMTGVRTITIPNTVTRITSSSFFEVFMGDCAELKVIAYPNSVLELPNLTLNDCGIGCDNMIIPYGVTHIGVLRYMSNDSIISLPDTLTDIEGLEYRGNRNFTLPAALNIIGSIICPKITKLTLPDSLVSTGSITVDCVKKLAYPKNMTSAINLYATSLESIEFSDVVTNLQYIRSNQLKILNVPSTVTDVSTNAFTNTLCMTVDFRQHMSVPSLHVQTTIVNYLIGDRFKIIVPDALYDTWVATTGWSKFAKYIYKVSELESNPPAEATPSGKYVSTSTNTDSHSVADFTITDGVVVSVNTGESYTDMVPQDTPNLTLSGNTLTVHHIYYGGDSFGDTILTYDPMTDSFSGKIYSAGAMERVTEIDATFIKE